jgi:FixJ family two-component response regulator
MPDRVCVAIIDDDESFCRSSNRMLHAAGVQSVAYPSAEDFFADPVRRRYACLLVDIQLGGMSGLEMQQALVAEDSRIPIIFITAYDDPGSRAQARRAGCAGFFRKTDDGALLLDTLRTILPPGAITHGATLQ